MEIKRGELLGVPVDCVDRTTALQAVERMIASGRQARAVIAVNPEKIMQVRGNPHLLRQLKSAGLLIPDGIGVVWAARILGIVKMERVPGSELMPAICALAARKGYRFFLFGARPDINAKAAAVLQERYPGLQVAGRQDGYLAADDMPALIERINGSGAHVLFVALGSPKQEMWMETFLPKLKIKVCQGVGGSFDVIAGTVKRAPEPFLDWHLEWFYRLMTQPKRARRQMVLPVFAWRILRQLFPT